MRIPPILLATALFVRAAAAAIPAPTGVIARAMTSADVVVSWNAVDGVAGYQVLRSVSGTSWTLIATTTLTSYHDVSVASQTAYLYNIRALGAAGGVSGDSNYGLATTMVFVDPTLTPGTTFIKAVHVEQLRTAVNAVRTLAALGAAPFGPAIVPGTTPVAGTDISDLRTGLDEALLALSIPSAAYTDDPISSTVTPIRAVHIQELRDRVNAPPRCNPGTGTCNANVSTFCSDDGMSLLTETCDPLEGMSCNATSGRCDGSCSLAALSAAGLSNTGCDFYPTVTANVVSSSFHFAVAIANANSSAATLTITQGATTIANPTVPANGTIVQQLPWVASLKGPDDLTGTSTFPASVLATQGSYRLRSTLPVTVYQFNPLEYTDGTNYSYTNDASLLLPAHAWGWSYRVAAQHHWNSYSGVYAVTAKDDNTVVTTTAPPALVIKSGSGLPTSGSGVVTLNAGDVLEIVTNGSLANDPSDPTGTLVQSTKPVQVIGSHQCTDVPFDTGYCDHLEESLPPLDSLSTSYVLSAPWISNGVAKVRRVRIVGTADTTSLTYNPPQAGFITTINAGQVFESGNTAASFEISSDKPVLVSEYMTGAAATADNAGDPAMSIAVGTDHYLTSYTFVAPTNYTSNFINVIAPAGTTVTLDGTALVPADFTAIGTSGYSEARKALANAGSGLHTITGSAPVGVSVYGYGQYTSYWYPAGMRITP